MMKAVGLPCFQHRVCLQPRTVAAPMTFPSCTRNSFTPAAVTALCGDIGSAVAASFEVVYLFDADRSAE